MRVAAMGVVLGSATGVVPAIGLLKWVRHSAMESYRHARAEGAQQQLPHVPIVVPWGTLAVLLIAVPVGAALLAALVTRSSTAIARKVAG